jgi:type I restriction enzyme, S subunit
MVEEIRNINFPPKEWKARELGEEVDFQGGSQPPLYTFTSSQKDGYVRLLQIRDYKTDKYETYIPKHLARKFCNKKDVMIGRYGPPVFQILKGLEGAYNVALMKAVPSKNVNNDYLYYFLKQETLFQFVDGLSKRTAGQSGVDMKELKSYPFYMPPISEQTDIATALNDADALITQLEKLIAKKRAIKQGAMQELLKPKEGWINELIKNLASISTGAKNTQDKIDDGNYPFFVRSQNIVKINSYSFDGEAILIAGDGVGTGKVMHYYNGKFDFHQRVYKISDFQDTIIGLYFFLFFKNNFYNRMMQMTAKSSVDSIRRDMISEMVISFPPIEEQTRIAQILSDMDAEIEGLEKKLEKTKKIKQGMMQELLTGRIRLEHQ